ncbi:inositol monophosphatase family protein [Aestuariispira insulae]|uniref:Inositol-1-monophosphatase n=1 Tax=Aestuariispira insulae TaxID=1461337 RepID=A0A3D9HXD6_9PROT|nr:inositol monophosphatase family protein [Aestuariispira insulae]RED54168.1 histidinol phosphatase-like enzyme (inositol monophosphatase family) [Aestuariispira insulae]
METALTLPTLEELANLAEKAANTAAEVSLSHFRNPLQIDFKGDDSPVTRADRETEQVLRDIILKQYPDHGIFGEEHGCEGLDRDIVWVLDPIDGTKSFISGNPMFGMLIAVLVKGKPAIGLIHMPALGETFIGQVNRPSLWNSRPLKTSAITELAEATCFIGEADKMLSARPDIYQSMTDHCRLTRFGYDCYTYGQLAAGHIDIAIERGLHPYDFCALIPVIEGAGGVITDWQGQPLAPDSKGDVLACSTAELHQKALEIIHQ